MGRCAGPEQLARRMELAWEFWLAHKFEYSHTKLFRVMESFASLPSVRLAVSRKDLQKMFMGFIVPTEDMWISAMNFRYGGNGKIEAVGTVITRNKDADARFRFGLGYEMTCAALFNSRLSYRLAMAAAPSMTSWGVFCFGGRANFGGCSPSALAKVF